MRQENAFCLITEFIMIFFSLFFNVLIDNKIKLEGNKVKNKFFKN